MTKLPLLLAGAVLTLAGCSGAHSTIRYGRDGQQERFIECSGQPMSRCYDQALSDCPQGYFLVENSEVPGGATGGSVFGHGKHVGAAAHNTQVTWKNELVVRCKPGPEGAPPTPATVQP